MPDKVAFGWYTTITYARLLEIISDRQHFPEKFEAWCPIAQRRFDALRQLGVDVEKVLIDPQEMLEWCQARRHRVDARHRAQFAALKLLEKRYPRSVAHQI